MNNELKKSLEMRQENLIFLLKSKKEQLELEKQHQIYGAIKEIDYILRMIKVTAEEEVAEIKRSDEDSQRHVVKIDERTKSFSIPIKIRFQKNEL
jgi:hypothetical protein